MVEVNLLLNLKIFVLNFEQTRVCLIAHKSRTLIVPSVKFSVLNNFLLSNYYVKV